MNIEVSNGEILDKFVILKIKLRKIKNKNKLININKEYQILYSCFKQFKKSHEIKILLKDLEKTNLKLWNIENKIRIKEKRNQFDSDFINLARNVYKFNDLRNLIKYKLNLLTNSNLIEEKSYH